jgi:thioredoxin
MPVTEISEQRFVPEVLKSEQPVLVEFGAEWCGPCKLVAPELEALAQELEGKLKIFKVDVDKSPGIAQQLGVQGVPTFVVFHNGRPAAAKSGAMKRVQLRQMVEPFLPRAEGAIKPEEAAQLVGQGRITLVDTRDAATFARVRLPRAVNLPLAEIRERLAELHMLPATPVLYCRSGEHTRELAATLAEEGVPVGFLEGGILGWEAAGLPVHKP